MSEKDENVLKIPIKDLRIYDEYVPVSGNISVREAAQLMRDYEIPDLVIVNDKNEPEGIVTAFHLVKEVLSDEKKNPDLIKISEIMIKVKPLDANTDLLEAAQYVYEKKLPLVPVVEKNQLIGVLTTSDILYGLQLVYGSQETETEEKQ
ncbi:MAG: cyclic nucleotide-binding/CBS domain-containing protein [Candidatus Asgardarchaeia archaeon]